MLWANQGKADQGRWSLVWKEQTPFANATIISPLPPCGSPPSPLLLPSRQPHHQLGRQWANCCLRAWGTEHRRLASEASPRPPGKGAVSAATHSQFLPAWGPAPIRPCQACQAEGGITGGWLAREGWLWELTDHQG